MSHHSYDGDGTRVSVTVGGTTTRSVYDVNAGLPVLLDDGSRKYVWGLGLAYAVPSSGGVEVYHTDGLNSVRAITNAAGTVTQTYQTDEFGIPTQTSGSSGQPFGYTGEPRDGETGFVYLRARLYDPQTGRFLQRDPFPGVMRSVLSLHRYTYVGNNPVNAVDPSGLEASGSLKNPFEEDDDDPFEPSCLDPDSQRICIGWNFAWTPWGIGLIPGILKDINGGSGSDDATRRTINPSRIRFSQNSISARFRDGRTVQHLADSLRSGRILPGSIPPIRLVERNGKLYTLDNRRLEAFRRSGIDVPYWMATPEEIAREWDRKFTTRNDGVSIRVRGE